jgi:tetratricopeptide (TPR) repeat protein
MPLLLTKSVIGYHRFLLAQGFLSHLRESLALARQAASKIGNKLTLADIIHKQGMLEVETGHYDLGASILLEGLELARTLNTSNIEIQKIIYEIYKNLGLSYRRQSLNQQASQYYEESLQIAKEMEDEWGIIEATIGLIEIEGNYHKAKIAYTEIVEGSSLRDSDHRVWINLLNSLSTICILEEEYDQALVYLQEGERLAILHGYHLHRIRTLWLLAAIRHIKGDETGANEYAQESLKIAREAGYLRSVSFLLGELGKWSLQKRNYSEAISYLNEAIVLGRKLGISGRHFRILHYWGELHLAKEQWHEAINIWYEVLEKAEEIIYMVAANYGLACVAKAQADEVSAKYYTSNWQALLAEMNSCQKRALKHWLPNIPINA